MKETKVPCPYCQRRVRQLLAHTPGCRLRMQVCPTCDKPRRGTYGNRLLDTTKTDHKHPAPTPEGRP